MSEAVEGAPWRAQPTRAHRVPLGAPMWVVASTTHLSRTSLAHWLPSSPKKAPKIFVVTGLRLVLIFYEVKNKQKTATGTGHYVNRLVAKNDRKLLQNDYKTSKNDNIIAWNNQKL